MCILRRPRRTVTVDYTLIGAHVLEGRQQLGRHLHNINLNRSLNLKVLLNLTGITDRTAARLRWLIVMEVGEFWELAETLESTGLLVATR